MEKLAHQATVVMLLLFAPLYCVSSDLSQIAPLSDHQWDSIHSQVSLLDKVAYLPSLLPVIMKHRDAIGLSYRQAKAFRLWRKENYQKMIDLMNEIIRRRIELSRWSLNAQLSNDQILDRQQEIFDLQEQVLRIRLSCRQIILSTFSTEQWDSFGFVLEEYPQFAGLLAP